jgi:hypothetical protein
VSSSAGVRRIIRLMDTREESGMAQGRTRRWRALGVVAATLLAGSAGFEAPTEGLPRQSAARKAWTVMLYVDADTDNIEADLLDDVEAAAGVGSGDDVNVVALVDRVPGQDDSPLLDLGNFDSAKVVYVEDGGLTELAEVGEVDMGDGEVLAWFLTTAMTEFPADHYAVFLDDHGGGIFGSMWDLSTELATGESSHLGLDETSAALASALRATGEDRFELFGYLACLMATYDAAAKLAPYANYMVGSEEVTFGVQADLTGMLEAIVDDPAGVTGAELGETLVDVTADVGGFAGRTQSVIDLRAIARVTQALESFADAARAEVRSLGPAIARAHANALHFGADPDPAKDFDHYDLGDLVAGIEGLPPSVATARNALYEAVSNAVVGNATGPATAEASGLSIFFPPSADRYVPGYERVTAAPAWAEFLLEFYEVGGVVPGFDPVPPQFQSGTATVEVVPGQGVLVSASLVPGSEKRVVSTSLTAGVLAADGSITFFAELPATLGAGRAEDIVGGWDLTVLQVTDADSVAPVTALLRQAVGGVRADVPILYQAPDGSQTDGMISMLIGRGGDVGEPVLLQYDASGAIAEIVPQPGGIFAPLVLRAAPGGSPRFDLLPDAAAFDVTSFGLTSASVPAGSTLALYLEAVDFEGNVTRAAATAVAA